jgi:hypothetical protein
VLLYQGIFKEQGFVFVCHHDGFDRAGAAEEGFGFYIFFFFFLCAKPVSQMFCLAHIDDFPFHVPHDVNARLSRGLSGRFS